MNMLRKIFLVVICALVICPVWADFYTGYQSECWVDDKGNDEYWLCGYQIHSCKGNKAAKRNTVHELAHHEDFEHNNRHFWCCDGVKGEGGKQGTFVEGKNWEKSSTKKTKSVGGGTCEYTETVTICGTVEGDCTQPTSCPDGKTLRNHACVSKCPSGQGFQSLLSNECVDCTGDKRGVDENGRCHKCLLSNQYWDGSKCATKTSTETKKSDDSCTGLTKGLDANGKCVTCTGTDYIFNLFSQKCEYCPETETQGVDKTQICIDCAPSNMVWDKSAKKCVEKQDTQKITSATKAYSSDMMYECYGCSSDIQFKKCLEIYRTAPDELSNIQKSVLKACNNTYDAANAKKMVAALGGNVADTTDSNEGTKIDLTKKQNDIVLANKELLEATKQATQVADVVAVADQAAMDYIAVPKITGTAATTGTSVATGATSITGTTKLKGITLPNILKKQAQAM